MEENKKVICDQCGKEIDIDNAIEYDGEYYCQECFDELFVECYDCGEIVPRAKTYTTYDGDLICERCYEDDYFTCEDCGEIYQIDEAYYIRDKDIHICEDCFNSGDYFCCEDCGDYYSQDFGYYISDNQDYYVCENCYTYGDYFQCEDCGDYFYNGVECYIEGYGSVCEYCCEHGDYYYDDDDGCYYKGDSIIGAYHTHGCFNEFGLDSRERRLGIELEVENELCRVDRKDIAKDLKETLLDHAYYEYDGSLRNGFEIITEPHTVDEFNKLNWERVLEKLSKSGYRSHDTGTCGLHIHVSRTWFGDTLEEQATNIAKLFICYSKNWGFFLKMSRRTQEQADRWASVYCTEENFETVKEVAKQRYDSRYRAVNNTNTNTVEFRLGRGTLNYKSFMAWIDIHIALSKNAETISEENASDLKLWLNGISDDTKEYIKSRSYEMYIELFGGAR